MSKVVIQIVTIAILLGFSCIKTRAQYLPFALYDFAKQQINPASVSLDNYASAEMIFRSQQSLSGITLNSAFASAKYPFFNKKRHRYASAGLSLGQDNSGLGGLLLLTDVGLAYALNIIPASKRNEVSIGTQVRFKIRSVNTGSFYTGRQYIPGQGFDQDLPSGELEGNYFGQYISLNLGGAWRLHDRRGYQQSHFSIAIQDLNTPDESIWGNAEHVSMTFVVDGGYRVFQSRALSVYGEMLYAKSPQLQTLNAGIVITRELGNINRRLNDQSLDLYAKYLMNFGMMLGVRWNNDDFLSIGTCYEIPLNAHSAHQGAFEVALKLQKLKRPKRRSSIMFRVRQARQSADDDRLTLIPDSLMSRVKSIPDEFQQEDTPPDTIQKIIVRYDYEFGKARPMQDEQLIVNEIANILTHHPALWVEVIGHTDDIGTEEYNQALSEERAKAIYDILIELGIDKNRITYYGEGESSPLSPHDRSLNRRVEVIFHDEEVTY